MDDASGAVAGCTVHTAAVAGNHTVNLVSACPARCEIYNHTAEQGIHRCTLTYSEFFQLVDAEWRMQFELTSAHSNNKLTNMFLDAVR